MTTPNPTTAERQREAAREPARQVVDYLDYMAKAGKREGRLHYVGQLITAALARERREALTEAARVALDNKPKDWSELDTTAERIAAAIEALRDGAGL